MTLWTTSAGAQAAPLLPGIDDLLVSRPIWQELGGTAFDLGDDRRLILELRRRRFDAALIFTSFSQTPHPAAAVCSLAGIPRRAGSSHEQAASGLLFDAAQAPFEAHQADRNLRLLEDAGFPVTDRSLRLEIIPGRRTQRWTSQSTRPRSVRGMSWPLRGAVRLRALLPGGAWPRGGPAHSRLAGVVGLSGGTRFGETAGGLGAAREGRRDRRRTPGATAPRGLGPPHARADIVDLVGKTTVPQLAGGSSPGRVWSSATTPFPCIWPMPLARRPSSPTPGPTSILTGARGTPRTGCSAVTPTARHASCSPAPDSTSALTSLPRRWPLRPSRSWPRSRLRPPVTFPSRHEPFLRHEQRPSGTGRHPPGHPTHRGTAGQWAGRPHVRSPRPRGTPQRLPAGIDNPPRKGLARVVPSRSAGPGERCVRTPRHPRYHRFADGRHRRAGRERCHRTSAAPPVRPGAPTLWRRSLLEPLRRRPGRPALGRSPGRGLPRPST